MNKKQIVLLGITGLLSLGCTQESEQEKFLQAEKHFEASAYEESIIQLKNLVQKNRAFLDARLLLAEAYLKTGQILNAKREYTRILENTNEKNADKAYAAVENFLLLSFFNQEFEDIESFATTFPELQNDTKISKLSNRFLILLGSTDRENIVSKVPFDAMDRALSVLESNISNQRSKLSQSDISALKTENDGLFLPVLGHYYLANGENTKCIETFEKVNEEFFTHPYSTLRLAQCHYNIKEYDKALSYSDEVLVQFPRQPLANRLKGTINFLNGSFDEAESHLLKAADFYPNDSAIKTYLGTLYLQQGYYEKAFQQLKGANSVFPVGHPARKILAITEIKLGNYDKGIEVFKGSSIKNEQANLSLFAIAANAAQAEGDIETRNDLIQSIASIETSSLSSELQKFSQLNKFKTTEEEINFDFIPLEAPENDVLAQVMIGTLYQYNQLEKLQQIAKTWQRKNQEAATFANGVESYLQGDYEAALKDLQTSKVVSPLKHTLIVESLLATQNAEKASKYLEESIAFEKPDILLLNQLFVVNIENNYNQNYVYKVIDSLIEKSFEFELLKAKFLLLESKNKESLSSLSRYKKSAQKVSSAYWKLLLKNKMMASEPEEVLKALDDWIRNTPNIPDAYIAKINYIETQGNAKKALEATNQALQKFDDPRLQLLQVNFLLMTNSNELAKQKFAQVPKATQNSPLGRAISASFALANKDFALAEEKLAEAYEKAPNPRTASMMFNALMNQRKTGKAISFLEKHISYLPSDIMNMRLLADALIERDMLKARSYYIFLLEATQNNHAVMNNLAWIENKLGNRQNALTLIDKALELKPNDPNYEDTRNSITK
ncbi:tetratricopeptide repeat protein [Alteromonas macleodii]|uniref:tetratricopeptide repeat protein n=1 Tax=Alteromonas macleodii TaxID=28108 RepID=UPI00313AEF94